MYTEEEDILTDDGQLRNKQDYFESLKLRLSHNSLLHYYICHLIIKTKNYIVLSFIFLKIYVSFSNVAFNVAFSITCFLDIGC